MTPTPVRCVAEVIHMTKYIRGDASVLCDVSRRLPVGSPMTDRFEDVDCVECLKWVDWMSGMFGPN